MSTCPTLLEAHHSLVEAMRRDPDNLDLALVYSDLLKELGREEYGEYVRTKSLNLAGWEYYERLLPTCLEGGVILQRNKFGLVDGLQNIALSGWMSRGKYLYANFPLLRVGVSDKNAIYAREEPPGPRGRQPHVLACGWWTVRGAPSPTHLAGSPAYLPPEIYDCLHDAGKVVFRDLEYKQYYIDGPYDSAGETAAKLDAYDLANRELSEACLLHAKHTVLTEGLF